jgi:hypothetical protein
MRGVCARAAAPITSPYDEAPWWRNQEDHHLLSTLRFHRPLRFGRSGRSARTLRIGVTLIFALGITALLMGLAPAKGASAASFRYRAGYSVQSGWLCYGWSNGALRCTQRWHRDASGRLISDNPSWVPNSGGVALGGSSASTARPLVSVSQASNSAGEPCRSNVYFNATTPTQWQVPPSCYAGVYRVNPANYVSRPGFGWCNWWPEVMNPSRPNILYGPYPHGTTPRPGAVVRFASGVQGASSSGHFGRVVAVHPGGYWFLISEMNFTWRGAGWQKVEYRYVHTGPGVSFIY